MSAYTPPLGNALLFTDSGDAHTPPLGNALLFVEGAEVEGPRLDIEMLVPVGVEVDLRRGNYADMSDSVGVSASFGLTYDWTASLDPLLLQEAYRLVIKADGFSDLIVPISTWQATQNRGERASYLQATVPAALDLVSEISARSAANAVLIIEMGFRLSDGEVRFDEVARSQFEEMSFDRGPRNATAVLRGFSYLNYDDTNARTLRNVRAINVTGGNYRATCDIDMFLRPGMTVSGGGVEFVAGYINMFVTRSDKFCQVGSRLDG